MFFDVTEAQYLGEYRIRLRFEDGQSGSVDLSDYVDESNVFRAFLDPQYFRNFRVEFGTLVWGEGEVDIAPETLFTRATGKAVQYRDSSVQV